MTQDEITINDLTAINPERMADELYIQPCHVTGMHDPRHTTEYVCELQLADLALRIIQASGIFNLERLEGESHYDYKKRLRRTIHQHFPKRLHENEFQCSPEWSEFTKLQEWAGVE